MGEEVIATNVQIGEDFFSPRVAILASEMSPTSQHFYEKVNSNIENVDWYKTCFSESTTDLPTCDNYGSEWMESEISNDFLNLIENLDKYDVIYLEDPTINYNSNYLEKLQNWVSEGNILVLSEHVMCREQNFGVYIDTDWRCNPSGEYNNDDWEIFDVIISQRGSAWGYPYNWNSEVTNFGKFLDLNAGERLSFEERNYVESNSAISFLEISRYRDITNLADSKSKTSIAYWNYGRGRIIYFGDSIIEYLAQPERKFSEQIIELILGVSR